MGYYLHRLKNGRSLYRGNEIQGGNHGFLRTKTWHLAASCTEGSGASLKYQITPDDFSPTEYPLKVSVDLSYTIDVNGVAVLFEFRNHAGVDLARCEPVEAAEWRNTQMARRRRPPNDHRLVPG